jgi:hypothetical protein
VIIYLIKEVTVYINNIYGFNIKNESWINKHNGSNTNNEPWINKHNGSTQGNNIKKMIYVAFFISCSLSMKSNLPSFVSRTSSSSLNSGFMINKDVVCIKTVFS